ncbi:MAG: SAM-dependent chlorinase/fluorinase [Desulforhopalus sp.]
MTSPPPIISLITDFGIDDEYVGVLKGVILSHDRAIRIVDISHSVPPQNIRTASHLLTRSYGFFPSGTVHLVIVDPGVGSDRVILAIHADGHYFVGPDNGIFSSVLKNANALTVHRITETTLFLQTGISNTFHGRDIMAPVAAQLATGLAIDRVGPAIPVEDCLVSSSGSCAIIDNVLEGEITHVDRFGNLCTNISKKDVEKYSGGKKLVVQIGKKSGASVDTFCSSYFGQKEGAFLALYDSHDFLEIAENRGNASKRLGAIAGTPVFLVRT